MTSENGILSLNVLSGDPIKSQSGTNFLSYPNGPKLELRDLGVDLFLERQ